MRLLVVEDEKGLAAGLKKGLQAEGFAVDVALDGREGLWMARENTYDAVVLDLMLPYVNGFRICSSLREEGDWTPILMLTAKDGEHDEAEALDSGADDYLTKPFSYLVLVARIRALLRRGSPERPVVLKVGDLELDPATRRCRRGGTDIALTPREFSLLEYLLRNQGDVVSKHRILEHVWDYGYDGDDNIVEVYIRRLRERIDRPFGRTSITTMRGAGYRIDPLGG
ncbi:MAG TPA: response regulator transcription factor [Actinomycetota bacterium]|nr:response regulator transcription factor [Actinomycetota bacterium]